MSIDLTNFQQVLQWVMAHGYVVMFLAMCVEGPTVTAAATFALTLGFFNPWVIFALSIMGDVLPDALYYGIGRWKGLGFVTKFGHKFGMTSQRIVSLEKTISVHGGKTVAVLKYTPILATPGLMLVGAMKMGWWRYLWFVFIVTLQKTLTFMLLGYFFGRAYDIGKYIKYGALLPFVFIIAYFVLAFLYKRISQRIVSKIEKI
jgi:membrane protein DedA with SNARE-associated domain